MDLRSPPPSSSSSYSSSEPSQLPLLEASLGPSNRCGPLNSSSVKKSFKSRGSRVAESTVAESTVAESTVAESTVAESTVAEVNFFNLFDESLVLPLFPVIDSKGEALAILESEGVERK